MTARAEWDALSTAHRVEVMREIDDAIQRCHERRNNWAKRGDRVREAAAARKAEHLGVLVDMLKEEECARPGALLPRKEGST